MPKNRNLADICANGINGNLPCIENLSQPEGKCMLTGNGNGTEGGRGSSQVQFLLRNFHLSPSDNVLFPQGMTENNIVMVENVGNVQFKYEIPEMIDDEKMIRPTHATGPNT